ncbi:MAG: amylo-alpha-1,6-glucosidase [Pyrinomonadaceae bacterium]
MIELPKDIVSDFKAATSREWLETNGIGGYASGTVSGVHTRRYHGLLVAATHPPLGRAVLLSKLEETVFIDGARFDLSANQYPEKIYPEGFQFLKRFRLDPFPVWTFDVDGIEIEKKVFMPYGANATSVTWSVKNRIRSDKRAIGLEVRPLIAFRDHHHLQHERSDLDMSISVDAGSVSMCPLPGLPALFLNSNAISVEQTGYWYRNFEYAIEQERGFDFHEDLFQPCVLNFDLAQTANVIASTEKTKTDDIRTLEKAEMKRRASLVVNAKTKDPFIRQLVLAADQFIVDRGDGKTVIAGYHWFSDWGRDTMIALPGLTLATNRPEIAKSILTEFSKHISEGMLPNRFPDAGDEPEYNTVDATLWFFEAARAYLEKTNDEKFVREVLYDKLVDIIDWHIRGTRHNIHVDTDGLLYAGEPGVQLTWMDAKIGDWVVTPRTGKPVEIQALWYNALRIISDLAVAFGDSETGAKYSGMDEVARDSFNGQFWNAEAECLYDVVDGDTKDASIRPNQIFAVSLHHSILDEERARKVVDRVEADLLTPVGLRSLSPKDPRYMPVYIGSPLERDAAYHQGTVWGWLIGPFVDAYRKTHRAQPNIEPFVAAFNDQISETMLGQISEIFDADSPHNARGCAAQAWSVAELLRVLA